MPGTIEEILQNQGGGSYHGSIFPENGLLYDVAVEKGERALCLGIVSMVPNIGLYVVIKEPPNYDGFWIKIVD